MSIPYLKKKNEKTMLMVHETPFIMIAGEVHNSNTSSLKYMEQVWDKAEKLSMNCLLLPVSWEMIEPEEGRFDFTIVDGLIFQARKRKKKIGILWFGSWKNAECMYAPIWVKQDLLRFRRAQIVKGKNKAGLKIMHDRPYTTLSYLCQETRDADARAFQELMKHMKDVDSEDNTVITVQVENETGLLGEARERSDEADRLFNSDVPQEFADYMKAHTSSMAEEIKKAVESGKDSGSWSQVFGEVAEEIFSAYYISSYVNVVAEAGKKEYPLPMSVNCWLDKEGDMPGQYPSGGPVARMHEVWNYCAPNIDIYSPDIYVPNFCSVCDEYTKNQKPLYIAECATHSYAGPRLVYSVGHYHALCYAPFGFEEMGEPFTAMQGFLFGMDVSDPALKTPQNIEEYSWYCNTLQEMMPLLTEKYGTEDLQAVSSERLEECAMHFGDFGVYAMLDHPMLEKKDGVCLVLKTAENECFILVNRSILQFFSEDPMKPNMDIILMEEGTFKNGAWNAGRRLNGDETAFMKYDEPIVLHVKFFSYA